MTAKTATQVPIVVQLMFASRSTRGRKYEQPGPGRQGRRLLYADLAVCLHTACAKTPVVNH
jgi:hypothetical protein